MPDRETTVPPASPAGESSAGPPPMGGLARGSCAVLAALACGTLLLGHLQLKETFTVPFEVAGDEPDYDSLGWELSQRGVYRIDFTNKEFADAYMPHELPQTGRQGVTTYRPPLYPLLLAGGNRVWGRQFWFARLLNVVCLSLTAGCMTWMILGIRGWSACGILLLNFVVLDPRPRIYSRAALTESLALLLTTLLCLLLIHIDRRRPREATSDGSPGEIVPESLLTCTALAGVLTGLLILTRSIFALWLPIITGWFLWTGRQSGQSFLGWRRGLLYLIAAVVVLLPWGYRNCQLTGGFTPLGLQGAMELAAGFSEAAWTHRGMWHSLDSEFDGPPPWEGLSGIERELAQSQWSTEQAGSWVRQSPLRLVPLGLMKLIQELRPHDSGSLYVLAFAIIGWIRLRQESLGRISLLVTLSTALGIMLTWSTAGRFLVPLLSVLHILAAAGISDSVRSAFKE